MRHGSQRQLFSVVVAGIEQVHGLELLRSDGAGSFSMALRDGEQSVGWKQVERDARCVFGVHSILFSVGEEVERVRCRSYRTLISLTF